MKRTSSILLCTLFAAWASGTTSAAAQVPVCPDVDTRYQPGTNDAQMRAAVQCLVNNERTSRGLNALVEVDSLSLAGTRHAEDMAARGYFAHDAPAPAPYGASPDERAHAAGYPGPTVLENIYYGRSQTDPTDATPKGVVDAWMGSTGHCNAILALGNVDVGVGMGTYTSPPLTPGRPDQIWHNWALEMGGGAIDDVAPGCPSSTPPVVSPPPPVDSPSTTDTTPATGATAGANASQPSAAGVSLRGTKTLTVRGRAIALRLRCLRATGTCQGTATVRTMAGKYLGRAKVSIRAGATKSVRLIVRTTALKSSRTPVKLALNVDGKHVDVSLMLRR